MPSAPGAAAAVPPSSHLASTNIPAPPPLYSQLASSSSSPSSSLNTALGPEQASSTAALQFDIVPRSDGSSFQVGYQGLQQRGFEAWLRGDVLIKWTHAAANGGGIEGDAGASDTHEHFSLCTIDLLATETIELNGISEVHQLHHSSLVLWRSPGLSASSTTACNPSRPPSTMPFEFPLPEHLPHCVHLPTVRLEYRLIASLLPAPGAANQGPITTTVLTHMTRYTPPIPRQQLLPESLTHSDFSEDEKVWRIEKPTKAVITLQSTLVRRAEPISIRIQIPPPDAQAVENGLRIRSVEAELIRVVNTRGFKPSSSRIEAGPLRGLQRSKAKGKGSLRTRAPLSSSPSVAASLSAAVHHNATVDGWEPHFQLLYSDDDDDDDDFEIGIDSGGLSTPQAVASGSQHGDALDAIRSTPSSALPSIPRGDSFSTILAHSGKACRFSMRRSLALNLTLVPPFRSPALPHPSPDHDAPPLGLSPLTAGTTGGGGGCESVTQHTALSSVQFRVKIYVRLRGLLAQEPGAAGGGSNGALPIGTSSSNRPPVNQDIIVEQEIFVLPSLAGLDTESAVTATDEGSSSHPPGAHPDKQVENGNDAAEEFDGYEDFQDSNDAFVDTLNQLPRITLDGVPSGASEGMGMLDAASAFLTQRPLDELAGDDRPPNLEESQHDLQIFPGREDEGMLPPPPHSAYAENGYPESLTVAEEVADSSSVNCQPPPAWVARNEDPVDHQDLNANQGEGVGERPSRISAARHAQSFQVTVARGRTPPPDFEATLISQGPQVAPAVRSGSPALRPREATSPRPLSSHSAALHSASSISSPPPSSRGADESLLRLRSVDRRNYNHSLASSHVEPPPYIHPPPASHLSAAPPTPPRPVSSPAYHQGGTSHATLPSAVGASSSTRLTSSQQMFLPAEEEKARLATTSSSASLSISPSPMTSGAGSSSGEPVIQGVPEGHTQDPTGALPPAYSHHQDERRQRRVLGGRSEGAEEESEEEDKEEEEEEGGGEEQDSESTSSSETAPSNSSATSSHLAVGLQALTHQGPRATPSSLLPSGEITAPRASTRSHPTATGVRCADQSVTPSSSTLGDRSLGSDGSLVRGRERGDQGGADEDGGEAEENLDEPPVYEA